MKHVRTFEMRDAREDTKMLHPDYVPTPNPGLAVLRGDVAAFFKAQNTPKISLTFQIAHTPQANHVRYTLAEFIEGRDKITGLEMTPELIVTKLEDAKIEWVSILAQDDPDLHAKIDVIEEFLMKSDLV